MPKAKNARSARPPAVAGRSTRKVSVPARARDRARPVAQRSAATPARRPGERPQSAAPRSIQNRTGRAGEPIEAPEPAPRAGAREPERAVMTRVTRETAGSGASSPGESGPAPTGGVPDVDRGAGRVHYVYCIIRSTRSLRFGAIGMDEQWPDVYTVNYQDLAAIASDVPAAPIDSTRENILAHERVNESVMRDHTVIPMSFRTIFKTHEDIVELLRSAYDAFSDVLRKMEDKLEFGLKVLWDRNEIVRLIEQEDEDIRKLKLEISSQKGSTYFARMQYGRMIDDALQQRSERYVSEFLQRLRDVSVASRVNRVIGDKMIMNAAFLVQREQEDAFDRRIKEIASAYEKLTFKYTGPWPPYNFVNIRLKLEKADQH
jgi:hypothetical protein